MVLTEIFKLFLHISCRNCINKVLNQLRIVGSVLSLGVSTFSL